jgi:hypothetical protein
MSYQWGPNGHTVLINNETLYWDDDSVLFASMAAETLMISKIGMLADVTPLDPGWARLTVWDRNLSGMLD